MGKKVMHCKPAPELDIVSGEETITLRFNVNMWANLQENEEGLEGLTKLSMPEMCTTIVYAAGKDSNKDFTYEKARTLVSTMAMENVNEIVDTFSESVGLDLNNLSDAQKKTVLKYLNWI